MTDTSRYRMRQSYGRKRHTITGRRNATASVSATYAVKSVKDTAPTDEPTSRRECSDRTDESTNQKSNGELSAYFIPCHKIVYVLYYPRRHLRERERGQKILSHRGGRTHTLCKSRTHQEGDPLQDDIYTDRPMTVSVQRQGRGDISVHRTYGKARR